MNTSDKAPEQLHEELHEERIIDLSQLPDDALVPVAEIVRQPTRNKPNGIRPIFPMSRAAWYAGVNAGKFPKPITIGGGLRVWRACDLKALAAERFSSKLEKKGG